MSTGETIEPVEPVDWQEFQEYSAAPSKHQDNFDNFLSPKLSEDASFSLVAPDLGVPDSIKVLTPMSSGDNCNEETLKQRTREDFLAWLSSGQDIFHISGKAGAGKSTLMKFLGRSFQVQSQLRHWAGDKQLIFAPFFFWNSGDKMQRSIEGLYRCLLFETCKQCPDLLPMIFPEQWARLESGPNLLTSSLPSSFRLPETKAAFDLLVRADLSSSHRICFFIDGLDEYDGDSVDHWHLANSFKSWTQSGIFKLCVSSRPHVEFLQSFANHQIEINDLTSSDIRQYCMAMFQQNPNFSQVDFFYQELIEEIVDLSEGVFLWAYLVVRVLLKGIGYRNTPDSLRRKLMMIPKGLDELFDQMLGSVGPEDRQLSDRLILIAIQDAPITNAITYSWLEDLTDPCFPFNQEMSAYTDAETSKRLESVKLLLDSLTRGLLEISPGSQIRVNPFFSYRVKFFHRTARDYILSNRLQDIKSRIPEFDVNNGIIRLLLAGFKFAPARPDRSWSWRIGYSPLEHHFHDTFVWMKAIHEKGYMIPSHYLEEFGKVLDIQDMCAGWDLKRNEKIILAGEIVLETTRTRETDFCFLCLTMWYGLEECLEPKVLETSISEISRSKSHNVLLSASLFGRLTVVQKLLSKGWNPDAVICVSQGDAGGGGNTIWDKWSTVWLVFLHCFARRALEASCRQHHEEPDEEFVHQSLILEEFLRWGVDSNIGIQIRGDWWDRKNISLSGLVKLSRPPNLETLGKLFSTSIAAEKGERCTREDLNYCREIGSVYTSGEIVLDSPFSVIVW